MILQNAGIFEFLIFWLKNLGHGPNIKVAVLFNTVHAKKVMPLELNWLLTTLKY